MTELVSQSPKSQEPELELSVVMPCLDEAETLEVCIRKARASMRKVP